MYENMTRECFDEQVGRTTGRDMICNLAESELRRLSGQTPVISVYGLNELGAADILWREIRFRTLAGDEVGVYVLQGSEGVAISGLALWRQIGARTEINSTVE